MPCHLKKKRYYIRYHMLIRLALPNRIVSQALLSSLSIALLSLGVWPSNVSSWPLNLHMCSHSINNHRDTNNRQTCKLDYTQLHFQCASFCKEENLCSSGIVMPICHNQFTNQHLICSTRPTSRMCRPYVAIVALFNGLPLFEYFFEAGSRGLACCKDALILWSQTELRNWTV